MSKLKTISQKTNKDSMYYQVADILKDYIKQNELIPGDKLPSERQLSAQLEVSRNSVREGLRLLETQGLIFTKTGIGSFVQQEIGNDSIMLQFIKIDFAEVLEIKVMLELAAIENWVARATDKEIEQLEQTAQEMERIVEAGEYPFDLDKVFHGMLIAFQKNKMLIDILEEINSVLDGYWRHVVQDIERLKATIPLHLDLVECIRQRNETEARAVYTRIYDMDIDIMENSKPSEMFNRGDRL